MHESVAIPKLEEKRRKRGQARFIPRKKGKKESDTIFIGRMPLGGGGKQQADVASYTS